MFGIKELVEPISKTDAEMPQGVDQEKSTVTQRSVWGSDDQAFLQI